jgi:hypothetical protein
MNHPTPFRYDCDGTRWTYHCKANTLAIYVEGKGDRHIIRLPGSGSTTVSALQILDPAHEKAGGWHRWPCLQQQKTSLDHNLATAATN